MLQVGVFREPGVLLVLRNPPDSGRVVQGGADHVCHHRVLYLTAVLCRLGFRLTLQRILPHRRQCFAGRGVPGAGDVLLRP